MSQLEFDFGMAAFSGYDDDQLGISIDHCGDEEDQAGAPPADNCTPFGFLSRPLDPSTDANGELTEGCGLLWWRNGDQLNAIPIDDPRVTKLLPKLGKGGSMQFCGAGNYALFDGEDPAGVARPGSYVVATKYGAKAHMLQMSVRTEGAEQVALVHGEGHGLVATGGGARSAVLRNAPGTAYLETNDGGNVIAGPTTVQGSMTVGGETATPLVLAEPLMAILGRLISVVAAINATTTGAPAATLASQLAGIQTKFLKGA